MSTAIDYPCVLILGPTFDRVTGGGITLTNLFAGWPAERLALASSDPCLVDPPPARSQFRLGSGEWRYIPLLRFAALMDKDESGPLYGRAAPDGAAGPAGAPMGDAGPGAGTAAGLRSRLRSIPKKGFHGLSHLLGSDVFIRPAEASDRLVAWARAFGPDLLYTHLGDLNTCRLVTSLAEALEVPVVLHVMDDWPSAIYNRGLLRRRLQRDTDQAMRRLVDGAAACLAISDAMAREYSARYGREWSYFHNPVEPARWRAAGGRVGREEAAEAPPAGIAAASREFRLVYSGRIGSGIESSVLDVCRAVAALRSQGRAVRFDLHSIYFDRGRDPRFENIDGVRLHGAIPDPDMAATLATADVLVLPFDFFGDSAAYARLSFPTKAPAYEATGVPILVYAPPGHAVSADAVARGWGYLVGEPRVEAVAAGIARLMDDEALRAELSRTALQDVEERHQASGVRRRFAETLAAAAGGDGAAARTVDDGGTRRGASA